MTQVLQAPFPFISVVPWLYLEEKLKREPMTCGFLYINGSKEPHALVETLVEKTCN